MYMGSTGSCRGGRSVTTTHAHHTHIHRAKSRSFIHVQTVHKLKIKTGRLLLTEKRASNVKCASDTHQRDPQTQLRPAIQTKTCRHMPTLFHFSKKRVWRGWKSFWNCTHRGGRSTLMLGGVVLRALGGGTPSPLKGGVISEILQELLGRAQISLGCCGGALCGIVRVLGRILQD